MLRNTLPAMFGDSALLARINQRISASNRRTTTCITLRWYEIAINAATEMMIGKTWKAISMPEAAMSASEPKTNLAPTPAKPTKRLKLSPSAVNSATPANVLRTAYADSPLKHRAQATVRKTMAT